MESVLSRFRVLHMTLPGQEAGAGTISSDFGYPSLDSLARLTTAVLAHYRVTSCVGLGAGLGANVLLRLGIQNNKILDGVILLNATAQTKGWTEWLYHKRINQVKISTILIITYVKNFMKAMSKESDELPDCVVDFLMWHHFGR